MDNALNSADKLLTISVGEGSALILLTDTCSPLLRSEGISTLLKRFFDLELFDL